MSCLDYSMITFPDILTISYLTSSFYLQICTGFSALNSSLYNIFQSSHICNEYSVVILQVNKHIGSVKNIYNTNFLLLVLSIIFKSYLYLRIFLLFYNKATQATFCQCMFVSGILIKFERCKFLQLSPLKILKLHIITINIY